MAFCCGGSRWIPDHTTRRVCTDPQGGEIAAIRGDVVMALPPVTHIARVGGEQDRRFELASMHVVVVATADAGSTARFRPVRAAWIQPDAHRAVCIGLLHHIAEHIVAAVTVHDDQGANTLLCERRTDIGYNSGHGGWAEADSSGKRRVFVRASKGYRRKLKHLVVLVDCLGDSGCD